MRHLLLGLAAAVLASPAYADPKAVIEKAIVAHGGKDVLTKYTAGKTTITGELTIQGMAIDMTATVTHAPNKLKTEMTMTIQGMKVETVQVTNGKKAKTTLKANGMDIDRPLSEAQQKEVLLAAKLREISRLVPLLDEKKYELKAEADEEVEKKKADVVSVKVLDHDKAVKLYFDKETHLLVKSSHEGLLPGNEEKRGQRETLYAEYKKVEGMMQPMKITSLGDGTVFLSAKVTEIKNLEKVDETEFAIDD
jgi:hypothetical protein